ncbi:hypothetical protein WISP_77991 [Willisornis vidua]|uniref:CERS6 synthase n=1 Tax=Willisornis vidua TaxID=1566151 RepID=A0ABQ9DAG7_9PASS|nr:hypothetical protein WISP_77991 [Willisornis vidua]
MAGILAWFWNERFWLPHNVTWADLQSTEEATFPQAEDLYLAFPLAVCIFMIRMLFERIMWLFSLCTRLHCSEAASFPVLLKLIPLIIANSAIEDSGSGDHIAMVFGRTLNYENCCYINTVYVDKWYKGAKLPRLMRDTFMQWKGIAYLEIRVCYIAQNEETAYSKELLITEVSNVKIRSEWFIAKPCALGLKVQANGPQKAQPNAILEKVFTAITKHPDEKRLEGLSKQLDWDVRSIQRWFRQRRNQEKPSTLRKFCESIALCPAVGYVQELLGQIAVSSEGESIKESPKFLEVIVKVQQTAMRHSIESLYCESNMSNVRLGYSNFLKRIAGMSYIQIQKKFFIHLDANSTPWLWNTRQCWNGYPYQPLMPDLHYYYMVELSFYWSLMFSQFIDVKRKDFGIMFTHHILAVILISFSYITNLTRVGTLIFCLHDVADIVLEAAKMANYCKCQKLSDFLFLTFAVVFIVSRLGIYPLWILNTTSFELYEALGNFPALWVLNVLLMVLQILHCLWSYLIMKTAYKAILKGKMATDARSDIESSSDEEESVPRSKAPHSTIATNGTSGANGTNGYLTGGTCSEEH